MSDKFAKYPSGALDRVQCGGSFKNDFSRSVLSVVLARKEDGTESLTMSFSPVEAILFQDLNQRGRFGALVGPCE